jgi:hypothetical protein
VRRLKVLDLTGSRAKIRRAEQLADEFDALFGQIMDRTSWDVRHGLDADGWYRFRWDLPSGPPDLTELALIFGDVCCNAQAALDYLTWQLVLADRGQPGRHTSFPAVKDAARWDQVAASNLKGIRPPWVELIRLQQPFVVGPASMLSRLDEANRTNKHRLLSVCAASMEELQVEFTFPDQQSDVHHEGAFGHYLNTAMADGEVIAEFDTGQLVPACQLISPPALRASFVDVPGTWTQREMLAWVHATISAFRPDNS